MAGVKTSESGYSSNKGIIQAKRYVSQDGVSLSYALEFYLKLKGQGKDQVFFRTANRNIRYVTNLLGDKPLSAYSSEQAGQFRDWLLEQGMGVNTVKRVFSTIRSIINICITELGWTVPTLSLRPLCLVFPIVRVDNLFPKIYRNN